MEIVIISFLKKMSKINIDFVPIVMKLLMIMLKHIGIIAKDMSKMAKILKIK